MNFDLDNKMKEPAFPSAAMTLVSNFSEKNRESENAPAAGHKMVI
jgi:hypothetical protein